MVPLLFRIKTQQCLSWCLGLEVLLRRPHSNINYYPMGPMGYSTSNHHGHEHVVLLFIIVFMLSFMFIIIFILSSIVFTYVFLYPPFEFTSCTFRNRPEGQLLRRAGGELEVHHPAPNHGSPIFSRGPAWPRL